MIYLSSSFPWVWGFQIFETESSSASESFGVAGHVNEWWIKGRKYGNRSRLSGRTWKCRNHHSNVTKRGLNELLFHPPDHGLMEIHQCPEHSTRYDTWIIEFFFASYDTSIGLFFVITSEITVCLVSPKIRWKYIPPETTENQWLVQMKFPFGSNFGLFLRNTPLTFWAFILPRQPNASSNLSNRSSKVQKSVRSVVAMPGKPNTKLEEIDPSTSGGLKKKTHLHLRKLTWIPKIAIFERRYILQKPPFLVSILDFGGVYTLKD